MHGPSLGMQDVPMKARYFCKPVGDIGMRAGAASAGAVVRSCQPAQHAGMPLLNMPTHKMGGEGGIRLSHQAAIFRHSKTLPLSGCEVGIPHSGGLVADASAGNLPFRV